MSSTIKYQVLLSPNNTRLITDPFSFGKDKFKVVLKKRFVNVGETVPELIFQDEEKAYQFMQRAALVQNEIDFFRAEKTRITESKPVRGIKQVAKLEWQEGDAGAWFPVNGDEFEPVLRWQASSLHGPYIPKKDKQRGFVLLLENPNNVPVGAPLHTLYIGWFEKRVQAQAKAQQLQVANLTWEKALKKFGPYDSNNSRVKDHPYRTKKAKK